MAALKYRTHHQKLRALLVATFVPGQACMQDFPDGTVCRQPIMDTSNVHLGHTQQGGYIGLVHAECNLRAAQMKRDLAWSARNARRAMGLRARARKGTASGRPW